MTKENKDKVRLFRVLNKVTIPERNFIEDVLIDNWCEEKCIFCRDSGIFISNCHYLNKDWIIDRTGKRETGEVTIAERYSLLTEAGLIDPVTGCCFAWLCNPEYRK